MKISISRFILALVTLLFVSTAAMAQYVWLDEKGVKQFSDQPPPTSVPKSRILKFSGKPMDSQDSATDTDADTSKTAKEKESIADREQAFKKRHDDQVTKEKKEADAAKAAATKADSCKRMKEYKATLDSGQRVLQPDANGNRSFMSDEKRAQESATVNQNLSDCN